MAKLSQLYDQIKTETVEDTDVIAAVRDIEGAPEDVAFTVERLLSSRPRTEDVVPIPSSVQVEEYGCVTSDERVPIQIQPGINHLHIVQECNAAGLRRLTVLLSSADLPTTPFSRFLITMYLWRHNADGTERSLRFVVELDGQPIYRHNPTLPGNTTIEYQIGFEMILTPKGWAVLSNNEAFISGVMG